MELTAEEQKMLQGLGAPSQAAANPFTAEELQLLNSLKEMQIDPNTGEMKPPQVSGADPDLAMNESVLDMSDRVKLTLGNKEGQLSYLKSKYEDAAVNTRGDLTIKKDGKWFYADPSGTDYAKDPWELTKDIVADSVGAGIVMGGALGATVMSGGLASVPGAAAGEYARTSLGRLVGTYQADALQQTKDIAFESALQLVGEKFIPGAKKGLDVIGDAVERLGVKMKAEEGARAIGKFYSKFNVGEQSMNTIMNYGKEVNQKMKDIFRAAGNSDARYTELLQSDSIEQVKYLAAKAPKILSETYKKMQGQIVDAVDDKFVSNIKNTAVQAYAQMADDGLAKVVRNGEAIQDKTELAKLMLFIKEKGRIPEGTKFALKTQNELIDAIQSTGSFDNNALKLASDPEAYALVKALHKNIDIAYGAAETTGKAAAKNMMAFKREMGDVLFSLSSKADDLGLNSMRKGFETYSNIVDTNVKGALDNVGQGGLYSKLNSTWAQLSRELQPLSHTYRQSIRTGSDKSFETFLNKVRANPGKNQLSKSSLESVEQAAQALGDIEAARAVAASRTALEINDAALAFNPYISRPGGVDLGLATFGVLGGNPALVTALAVKKLAGSPQVTKSMVNASQNMWKGLGWLKSQPVEAINMMSKNPVAATAFINSQVDATALQNQLEQQMMSQLDPNADIGQVPEQMMSGMQASLEKAIPQAAIVGKEIRREQLLTNSVGARYDKVPESLKMVVNSEAKGNPAATNLSTVLAKKDKAGGLSAGMFQFSSEQGTLQEFVDKMGYKGKFKGLDPKKDQEAYAERWVEVYRENPKKFAEDQIKFVENEWQETKTAKAALTRSTGVQYAKLPVAVQKLVMSTAVAHGGAGASEIFSKLTKADAKDPVLLATKMNLSRLSRWMKKASDSENKAANAAGWVTRTIREQKEVIEDLTGNAMSEDDREMFRDGMAQIISQRNLMTEAIKKSLFEDL